MFDGGLFVAGDSGKYGTRSCSGLFFSEVDHGLSSHLPCSWWMKSSLTYHGPWVFINTRRHALWIKQDTTSLFVIGHSETRGRKKALTVFIGMIPYQLSSADMHGQSIKVVGCVLAAMSIPPS